MNHWCVFRGAGAVRGREAQLTSVDQSLVLRRVVLALLRLDLLLEVLHLKRKRRDEQCGNGAQRPGANVRSCRCLSRR